MEFISINPDTMGASVIMVMAVVIPLFIIFATIAGIGKVVASWFEK